MKGKMFMASGTAEEYKTHFSNVRQLTLLEVGNRKFNQNRNIDFRNTHQNRTKDELGI